MAISISDGPTITWSMAWHTAQLVVNACGTATLAAWSSLSGLARAPVRVARLRVSVVAVILSTVLISDEFRCGRELI